MRRGAASVIVVVLAFVTVKSGLDGLNESEIPRVKFGGVAATRKDGKRDVVLIKVGSVFFRWKEKIVFEKNSNGGNVKLLELFEGQGRFKSIFENVESGAVNGVREVFEIEDREVVVS